MNMDETDATINGQKYHITKDKVKNAFNQTKPEDWEDFKGPEPYHMIVINGEQKPVKAVFRKIFSTNNFITSDGERVLDKLGIKYISHPQIFLAPRSDYHSANNLQNTIDFGIQYNEIESLITDIDIKNILKTEQNSKDKLMVWGNTPGRAASWNKMNSGDLILFYQDRKYTYAGNLLVKFRNKALSDKLWGPDENGVSWEYVYFLTTLRKLDMPANIIQQLAGYESEVVLGFQPLNDKGMQAIISQYGSVEAFIDRYTIPADQIGYWKIAPGARAEYWPDMSQNSYIAVGWSEMDDINGLDEETLKNRIMATYPNKTDRKRVYYLNQLSYLLKIKEGDIIVANKGINRVIGIGKVTRAYKFDNTKEPWKHTISVNWYDKTEREIPVGIRFGQQPITPLDKGIFEKIVGNMPEPQNNPASFEEHVKKLLGLKQQLILYGPPGTSKTYNAKRFAAWFLTNKYLDGEELVKELDNLQQTGKFAIVQFHPSYSYEDFVEGIRPENEGSVLTYKIKDGIFKQICTKAFNDPGNKYVLVIDEINRGQTAKIFGELIYALEYRGEGVKLQYSGSSNQNAGLSDQYLIVPKNLFIIGTMNTADRSIALIDIALRRRFSFIPCMPDFNLASKLLGLGDVFNGQEIKTKYVNSGSNQNVKYAALSLLSINSLNEKIASEQRIGREKQIGHTFLLPLMGGSNPTEAFEVIWRYNILPLLEEYFYYDYKKLAEIFGNNLVSPKDGIVDFSVDNLRKSLEKLVGL